MGTSSSVTFSRRGPDILTEELLESLSEKASFEFKHLFDIVFARLRARKSLGGGEEMLRLRVYEKLQSLVSQGVVKKTITSDRKTYQGISEPLVTLSAQMKAFREEWTERRAHA